MYEIMTRVNMKNFFIVPLIGETPKVYWRIANLWLYKRSRHFSAPNAGREFGELFDLINMISSDDTNTDLNMSLMANSQGNLSLRVFAAYVKQKRSKLFENIFMVAADVPREFFTKDMNPGYHKSVSNFDSSKIGLTGKEWKYEVEKNCGYDVVNMVKKKVYVLWSPKDVAFGFQHDMLMFNCFGMNPNSLGESGDWAADEDGPGQFRRSFRPYVEFHQVHDNVNYKDSHAYKFIPELVKFYESKCTMEITKSDTDIMADIMAFDLPCIRF